MTTPLELVTSVEGSDVRVRLAGRTVNHGVLAVGHHDPYKVQERLHNQALDALAEAIKHAMHPELWEHNRQLMKRQQSR
ncbi:hypothetical protein [Plantactinospora soyae]|uniref:Uncharacterized protein n=1 Tax=Plantactinospora soyae TaxID=1544732 RepID=A0A927M2V9_9ACTN|nr:hypothetical protein [Plantactinospora soyae]MBE1485862.1 hypothetical protein [Plantactinospora soyae]